jgi:enoyl-CoA hydratase/carnithine racemase
MSMFKRIRGAELRPKHFGWKLEDKVATVTLDRPERKNPLSFQSYGELRDTFRELQYAKDVKAVVLTGAGGNFCSGGDVREIIGPLLEMKVDEIIEFNRMAGDLVKAMRNCPQPIVAAVDGVCAGAGAILAMASDLRYGSPRAKIGFLFARVGLPGCDMGACNLLPRIVGAGRAAELLYRGRTFGADEALANGFFNGVFDPDKLLAEATAVAAELANGPSFAHSITKRMIHKEWDMGIDEAVESEGQAMALAMFTQDYRRAYEAFINKRTPKFEGN